MVLSHHAVDRDTVFITNAVLCRPENNRTPTAAEVKACHGRLVAEIQATGAETILALGNTAAHSFLRSDVGITQLRTGLAKESDVIPGVKVIPTFHPAACLRLADLFPSFVTDVGKVNSTVTIHFEPPKWAVFDEHERAVQVLVELGNKYSELVVDIETGLEKDSSFEHTDRHSLLCVGLGFEPGRVVVIGEQALRDGRVKRVLGQLLDDKDWIAHNGKFDLAGVRRLGRGKLRFDTMLASYALDERQGTHGLKYLAAELLGAPNYDLEVKRFVGKGDSYAVVPRDVLYKYNAYDVACTHLLAERYRREMDAPSVKLNAFLTEASSALMESEMEGIGVDISYLDTLAVEYAKSLDALEDDLKPWVRNPRSPKQVKEALDDMGFRVESTAADILIELLGRCEPGSDSARFINLMLRNRKEAKLYGTYIKGVRKRIWNSRIYPTFLLHGTTTGRLSCRNPNLQNVPRGSLIRNMYVPEEGNVFVQADYATVELRVLATLAGDEYLRGLFNEGRDIHNEISTQLYGPDFTKEQRVRTKAVVYGLSYGREAYSIAQEYDMKVNEAQHMMNEFFRVIPDVVAWKASIKHKVLRESEDLETPFGRRRRFWLITNENRVDVEKEAYAFFPQSIASDICLAAFIKLRSDHNLSVRLPVHDSILVECSRGDSSDVAKLMKEVMSQTATEVFTDYVPFPVDVKVGNTWGEV
jgi:DNA polymerase I-like protein with 3'-5' exonuclease and polymerase domains